MTTTHAYDLSGLGRALLLALLFSACTQDAEFSYAERRSRFASGLIRQSDTQSAVSAGWGGEPAMFPDWAPPPGRMREVTYESDGMALQAQLYLPPDTARKAPALMYLHGGLALSEAAIANCKPFIEAGFVVMAPAYRGENGNPGYFELLLGEVDDAAAAARWLAAQPFVDATHVYALGWSGGGSIAALLPLLDDVPVRHSASIGGLLHLDNSEEFREIAPFDPADSTEWRMRLLLGNIRWMKHPHYAYLETAGPLTVKIIDEARREMPESRSLLRMITVAGDHFSMFPGAISMHRDLILEEMRMSGR